MPCINGNKDNRARMMPKIVTDLFNMKNCFKLLCQYKIIGREVDSKQDDKNSCYNLAIGAVASQTVIFYSKTTGSCRTKVMQRVSNNGTPPNSRKMI